MFMTGHNDDFGGSMIVGTERTKRREIGGRYTGLWVDGVLYDDQPFVVLLEATFEGSITVGHGRNGSQACVATHQRRCFYEVS